MLAPEPFCERNFRQMSAPMVGGVFAFVCAAKDTT
jgi:hypothetical protein